MLLLLRSLVLLIVAIQLCSEQTSTVAADDVENDEPMEAASANDGIAEEPQHNGAHKTAELLMKRFFDSLLALEHHYGPDIITVQDAADMYPILAKSSSPCPFRYDVHRVQQTDSCFTPIITIYDRISNSPRQQKEPIPLPQVLLLSALDNSPQEMDILGPSSIYETIQLLLKSAHCESLSPWVNASATNATECRQKLQSSEIDDSLRKWLARLVVTRRILAVPIADVAGFYYRLVNELSEGGQEVIVNNQHGNGECDFPYPRHWSPSENGNEGSTAVTCMSTYPARIMNELFRSHAFQFGVALHGSSDSGSAGSIEVPRWDVQSVSYDEEAMTEICAAMSSFGARGSSRQPYKISAADVLNLESNCNGSSMENWAFAAGFSSTSSEVGGTIWLDQCVCDTDACNYPSERTNSYDGSSLRSFIARVVSPPILNTDVLCLPGFDVGNEERCEHSNKHVLLADTPIGTNVRTSLLGSELVEPWTSIRSVAGVELRDDDFVPFSPRLTETCQRTRAMKLPESPATKNITVTWSVGGALKVDETAVMYGKWKILDKQIFNCGVAQPTKQEMDAFFSILRDFEEMEGESEEQMETEVTFTPVQSGFTRWHSEQQKENVNTTIQPETTFSVTLDLSRYKVGDMIAIYALARVDQEWVHGHFSEAESSGMSPPQSNIVNVRTNPEWIINHELDSPDISPKIKGRLDWFSVPVTIEIGEQPGFFESTDIKESSVRLSDSKFIEEDVSMDGMIIYAIFMALLTIIGTFTW